MGTNAVQRGPTADTVATNVKRLREEQNLGLRAFAARLADTGRPLTHTALDKIERGTRRVDVDDLMALAAALGASPTTLLMPKVTDDEWNDSPVEITGLPEGTTAERLWRWLRGEMPLVGDTPSDVFDFISRSVPNPVLRSEAEVKLIEHGARPNRTYSVQWRGQRRELGSAEHGDN